MRPGSRVRFPREAALLLLGLLFHVPATASAQADSAPPALVNPPDLGPPVPVHGSYTRAYLVLGAGVVLSAGSFWVAGEADRAYARYQDATDLGEIDRQYGRARRFDRLSAASLVAGQGAIALGIYWRFLRHPHTTRAFGVTPFLDAHHVGLAFACRFP